MNRLIRFFKSLDKNNVAYTQIYEGPNYDPATGSIVYDPTYWKDGISYHIERTNKLTLNKPCVTIKIPLTVFERNRPRLAEKERLTTYPEGSGTEKLYISDMGYLVFGSEKIDVRGLSGFFSFAQLNAAAYLLRGIALKNSGNIVDVKEEIEDAMESLNGKELDDIYSTFFPNMSRWLELPRKNELYGIINRMKKLDFLE